MRLLLLFCVLVAGAAAWWRPSWVPPITDESCDYSRADAYVCIAKYMDVSPHDGLVSRAELDAALDKYAPLWVRPLKWFITTEQAFNACDYDKDGFISAKDWKDSFTVNFDCLPWKKNWCQVEWFCDRARQIEGK